MIIFRAFTKEAARNTIAITLVLVIIMAFVGLTTLLGRAVKGDVPGDIVLQLLGLETLRRLDFLLTIGLYLGVLLTLARWYRDSEMTVLAACGIGLVRLLRPTLMIAVVTACVTAALTFYFTPWAIGNMDRIKIEREQQAHPTGIAPGVFNDIPGGRTFYAERVDRRSGAMAHIFGSGLSEGKQGVVAAQGGYTYTDEHTGDQFLALLDGNLYDGEPGTAGYRLLQFKTLHVRLDEKPTVAPPLKEDGMTTQELLARNDASARTELQWRLSKPVMALVLVWYALVLAYTDPRRGRLSNFFAAVLIYVIYSNMLALGQTFLKKGYVPWSVGLWWVHGSLFVIAVYLFTRRAVNRPLFSALPSRRRARPLSAGGA